MDKGIVLFDGVCNFCNRIVQFLIKRDRNDHLRFASLQSDAGRRILKQVHFDPQYNESVLFLVKGKIWKRSDAFCQIMRRLPGAWKLCYGFIIIPRFIRDWFYHFISSHRYQWFGRRDHCMTPPPEWKEKFLS